MEMEYVDETSTHSFNLNDISHAIAKENIDALLSHVPEEWPHIKELNRAKSCANTAVYSTCVNKAQAHLEQLQNAIYDWVTEQQKRSMLSSSSFDPLQATQQEKLQVFGVGISVMPYLGGAEDVIESATRLITRLESDRLKWEECIVVERQKIAQMANKMENLAHLRMNLLPSAVQREHEQCSEDIEELKWHVLHKSSEQKRLHTNREEAKEKQLTQESELAFIEEHGPLVKEKLQIELDRLKSIEETQKQAHEEMKMTEARLASVEEKHAQSVKKAESERLVMKQGIEHCEKQLATAKTNLSRSRDNHDILVQSIDTSQQMMTENIESINQLHASIRQAQLRQNEALKLTSEMQGQLRQLKGSNRNIEDAIVSLEAELDNLRASHENQRQDMTSALYNQEDRYTFIRRGNDEIQMICDDMEKKIKEDRNQTEYNVRSFDYITRELEKARVDIEKYEEEYNVVAELHAATTEKLETEERRIHELEDKLRATLAQLEKQIKEEIQNRGNLQIRIKTDTLDLAQAQEEAKIKRRKMRQMVAEIEKAVAAMLEKVIKLRKEKAECQTIVDSLQAVYNQGRLEYEALERKLRDQLNALQPDYDSVKSQLEKLNKQWNNMNWQTDKMNEQLEEILEALIMIKRSREKLLINIYELEQFLIPLNLQNQSDTWKEEGLQTIIKDLNSQMESNDTTHKHFMNERQNALTAHLDELDRELSQNKEMASHYRLVQSKYFDLKERYLNLLAEKILSEYDVKDLKELRKLEKNLHFSLVTYLKYKNNFTRMEVDGYEKDLQGSSERVQVLRTTMQNAIEKLDSFMNSQIRSLIYGQRHALPPNQHQITN